MLTGPRIFLCWVLLLLPTLALGVWGWKLIQREEMRAAEEAERARNERLAVTGETLALYLEEAGNLLIDGLLSLPDDDPRETMRDWVGGNPLVGESFLWRPGEGVVFSTAGGEGEAWLLASDGGEVPPWPVDPPSASVPPVSMPQRENREEQPATAAHASASDDLPESAPASPRQELRRVAQQDRFEQNVRLRNQAAAPPFPARTDEEEMPGEDVGGGVSRESVDSADRETPELAPRELESQGWLVSGREGAAAVALGWLRFNPDGEVRGALMDRAALDAALAALLSDAADAFETLLLRDANGITVAAAGADGSVPPSSASGIALPIRVDSQDWHLILHRPIEAMSTARVFPASLILLGTFLVAILSGGSLLLWQAWRNALDSRRKTGFVSSVSHELKTPLTSLRMYADLLADGDGLSKEKKSRYLDVIRAETHRLGRMVDNVLGFSRLERGHARLRPGSLDLGAAVEELIEGHRAWLEGGGLNVSYQSPDTPVWVFADRDSLGQVLLNLFDNVVKYAGDGGCLDVVVRAVGRNGQVEVMDRGPGIPRAHRRLVFKEFHRVDDSLTARGGCGLGLSIAHKLLTAQQGDLAYSPRDGGGAVFSLTLPVSHP